MVEIILNDGKTILSEFKVERVYEWNDVTRKNDLIHKTFYFLQNRYDYGCCNCRIKYWTLFEFIWKIFGELKNYTYLCIVVDS